MSYRIRNSSPADGEALLSIWRSSVASTHDFVAPLDLAAIDVEVRRLLPELRATLAIDDGGTAIAFMSFTDGVIEALFVAGEQRGRGAGRALVEHARMRSSSLATAVNEQNHQAVGFYRHLGFRIVGRSETDGDGRPYPLLRMEWKG